jgi:hypothetical protein
MFECNRYKHFRCAAPKFPIWEIAGLSDRINEIYRISGGGAACFNPVNPSILSKNKKLAAVPMWINAHLSCNLLF